MQNTPKTQTEYNIWKSKISVENISTNINLILW